MSEFDLVQDLLLRDTIVSPDRAEVVPLACMMYCSECGEPMAHETISLNGKKYICYVYIAISDTSNKYVVCESKGWELLVRRDYEFAKY